MAFPTSVTPPLGGVPQCSGFYSAKVSNCPFCTLPAERIWRRGVYGMVIRDGFPISPGHTLVIPHRHIGSFFDLSADERADLFGLLDAAKKAVDAEFKPQGFNIGINDGPAAGQTVPHLHIHLIPRYEGDQADPANSVATIFELRSDSAAVPAPSLATNATHLPSRLVPVAQAS